MLQLLSAGRAVIADSFESKVVGGLGLVELEFVGHSFPALPGTPAVQLALPLAGCAEDLHLQVRASRAHEKAPAT